MGAGDALMSGIASPQASAVGIINCTFDLPGSHREQRLGAIQRLDLRFLIDAEHQRVVCGLR